ncbi:60S ribosomal protein L17 [Reticulomyxa filosa]|uniref:60S ribosomal protein L17 n=1 Tax=Reticulomyxa filosa TaxID=46433 RepID=X6NRM7_RETFI|nr:60S ribosomal protein L17 [Reticulomyxa filosa]|eukprot:ETO27982.1 60S ribosomal protein L17 [Reticulomyxa filosa]
MTLPRARRFLKNVIKQKEIVPYRRHTVNLKLQICKICFAGRIGRHGQCKGLGSSQGRWPKKSAMFLLDLLRNVEGNARAKKLNMEKIRISHIAVQRARQGRRRTYRAHGRINPFNSHQCHIELFAEERQQKVPRSRTRALFSRKPGLELTDKKQRKNQKKVTKALRTRE